MRRFALRLILPLLFLLAGCGGAGVRPLLLTLYTGTDLKLAYLDLEEEKPTLSDAAQLGYGPRYEPAGDAFALERKDLVTSGTYLSLGRVDEKKLTDIAYRAPLPADRSYRFIPTFDPSGGRLAFKFVDESAPGIFAANLQEDRTDRLFVDRLGVAKMVWGPAGLYFLTGSAEVYLYVPPVYLDKGTPLGTGRLSRLGPADDIALYPGGVLALAPRRGEGEEGRYDVVRYGPDLSAVTILSGVGPLLATAPDGRIAYLARSPADPDHDVLWVAGGPPPAASRPYPLLPSLVRLETGGGRAALLCYGEGRPYYLVLRLDTGEALTRLDFGEVWTRERFSDFLELGPMDW